MRASRESLLVILERFNMEGHVISSQQPPQREPSYVVGIGASAGGLEALERLFDTMPDDTGMAFVVIQHLSPHFKSLMDELLASWTRMPIRLAQDGMQVNANCIYLMPATKEMIISDGKLLLTDKKPSDELTLPIDQFFRSLARDVGNKSVAIVLSGTGSDGSRGVCDVHSAGGLVLAQSSETAKFDGMPQSAVERDVVDHVLAPEDMPAILLQHADPSGHPATADAESDVRGIAGIFRLLRDAYGIDFSYYRPTTIDRRLQRRLQLIHSPDLDTYLELLRSDGSEMNALYNDLLIGVTGFFRDRDAFESIERELVPQMLSRIPANGEFRVWVAGCATGEEAYSWAILIHEQLQRLDQRIGVKIFATDVHRQSLDTAALGVYPAEAVAGVSTERLSRYFMRDGDGYHVVPELRQMVVFAPHNITKDAPFTRLDLISCRNLLIYLEPPVQKKALSLFHFGLKTGGVLFLGPSESAGDIADEFDIVDQHWKVFRKRRDVRLPADMGLPTATGFLPRTRGTLGTSRTQDRQMNDLFARLLEETLPPGVLLNERREILHSFGDASQYLQLRKGKPSLELLELLRDDLKLAAAGAIHRATRERKKVLFSGVRTQSNGQDAFVNLAAQPIENPGGQTCHILLTFEATEPSAGAREAEAEAELNLAEVSRDRVDSLETELRRTKENLQATIEELEANNEEMQATNEEMLASNEELQSTNEELHSVNEELYTVNAEFQKKIAELTELTNDMDNLLLSTEVHTIFLDEQLCIRKFTPKMAEVFNLIPGDIGRRIDGFMHTIECQNLQNKLSDVLEHGTTYEEEVRIKGNDDFLMRILPYRGDTDRSGIVMTLVNITGVKQAEERFRHAVEAAPSGMVMIDEAGEITLVNSESERMFGYSRKELLGQRVEMLMPESVRERHIEFRKEYFRNPRLRAMDSGLDLSGLRKNGEQFPLDVRLSPIETPRGRSVLAAIVDVTDRKRLESSLRDQVVQRDRFLATLSHELRNPMAAILTASSLLKQLVGEDAAAAEPCAVIRRQSSRIATLLDDLLDVSRITQNKVNLRREVIDLTLLGQEAMEAVGPILAAHPHEVFLELADRPLWVNVDRSRMLQVLENLLTNAIKYSPDEACIWLTLERQDDEAVIQVRDQGRGIAPELLVSIFDMFVQGDETLDRSEGGMGVGLTLVRSLVELHDGTIEASSFGVDAGSEFVVRLPLSAPPAEQATRTDVAVATRDQRIVLVEDSDDTREMLAALLAFEGYQVQTAADGQQGVETILSERPDIALVDIGLPHIDGYQVARRVREGQTRERTRLIALTGYGRDEDRAAVLEAGFDEHLVKPVDIHELKAVLTSSGKSSETRAGQ